MIIDMLRALIGQPPEIFSIANLPAIIEYLAAVGILIGSVYLIIHNVFVLTSIFRKKG